MLRYRSVSSLRDQQLFSPPAFTKPQGQRETTGREKKTLFINEFPIFHYNKE